MNTPSPGTPIPRKGYLFVISAAVLWAVSGSAGKYLFNHGVTPYQVVQMRVTLTTAMLFLWLAARDRRKLRIPARDILYFMVLGVTGLAMVQFTYFYTISKIKVAAAILLEYLAPVLIALYSVTIARERLTWPTAVAVTGATLGCYLVVGGYNLNLFNMNKAGLLSGLASAVSFAWYSVHGEHGMRRYSPWTVLFYAFLFAALFWNMAHPPLESFRHDYTPMEWVWILYIAILGTLIPFGLYFHGINLIRSTRASITATLEPITAGIVSYLFLGETLEGLQIVGGLLVIGAVVLLQIRREFDDATPELLRTREQAS
ncbi:Permease of the drug/metabolite transporter (DMT) superfamily [Desulfacinum hydrothermale DSM 13146]|uniref:Permease of the drug/metabolite transporter (DMT) superfamily n=1 Tax=Desulfacinum hydrothermale DSM 13146 TaxID=1121390 RepID=A0A1W1XFA2_9BACT|nr:EamA family transporter [Desulfacinum hydrothermale]SMC22454.1 Permease of the drug/metabolite transporter (DMT) superfamily [Desulfacinum hydrothermale DSM 13146]